MDSARDFARRERPLEGLRVLELGALIVGPFATRIMAERTALRGRGDLVNLLAPVEVVEVGPRSIRDGSSAYRRERV
jgi:hypothetical protein